MSVTANLSRNLSVYSSRDYRRFAASHLQFLSGICQHAMKSVNNSIDKLLSSFLLSEQLLPSARLYMRINATIDGTRTNAPTDFMRQLFLLRSINHGNAIISAYGTNFKFVDLWPHLRRSVASTKAITYDNNCSCDLNMSCITQAGLSQEDSTAMLPLKGLNIGCTPSEAFLLSTLECFYDAACIRLLREHVYKTSSAIDISTEQPLSTNLDRFPVNATIMELLRDLFTDTWLSTVNYPAYFRRCSPSSCSYTYTQQLNSLDTLLLLLSLFGGLTLILKWISPKIIRVCYRIYQYQTKRRSVIQTAPSTIRTTYSQTSASTMDSGHIQDADIHLDLRLTVSVDPYDVLFCIDIAIDRFFMFLGHSCRRESIDMLCLPWYYSY